MVFRTWIILFGKRKWIQKFIFSIRPPGETIRNSRTGHQSIEPGTIFKDSLISDAFFSGTAAIHFWPEIGAKDALMWMLKTDDGCPIDQPGKFGYWDDALKEATPEQISWFIPTPPTCEDIILGGTARQVFQFKVSDWLRSGDFL